MVNVFVITPLRFLFLIVLVSTTVEVLTQAARERSRVNRWRKRMKDQTVIVGFGVKGQAALRSLVAHGLDPRTMVVIAADRYAVAEATRQGVTGVVGDARSEQVLRDAGVPDGQPGDRRGRPGRHRDHGDAARARDGPGRHDRGGGPGGLGGELLRQSGADRVITHAESAGNLMGLSMLSANVGEMIEDLMDTGRGSRGRGASDQPGRARADPGRRPVRRATSSSRSCAATRSSGSTRERCGCSSPATGSW